MSILLGFLSVMGIIHLDMNPNTLLRQRPMKKEFNLGSGVRINMIWVEPGSFLMGSPEDELERNEHREKQHRVTITRGFWLAETEFTQSDWTKLMKDNPSQHKGDDRPVEMVSWDDVMLLIEKLNKNGGKFRLPTEAEWEYACRAGSSGPYAGNRDNTTWHSGNSGRSSHPVKTKLPNPWGFYDMNGNILEWCSDWFQEDYSKDTLDPKGPTSENYKVQRGGQFSGRIRHSRAADRQRIEPDKRFFFAGFRLAADGD